MVIEIEVEDNYDLKLAQQNLKNSDVLVGEICAVILVLSSIAFTKLINWKSLSFFVLKNEMEREREICILQSRG